MNQEDNRRNNDAHAQSPDNNVYEAVTGNELGHLIDKEKKLEDLIGFILKTFNERNNESIFARTVRYIGKSLDAEYVFVSMIQPDGLITKTLSVARYGVLIDDFSYELKEIPPPNQNIDQDVCLCSNETQIVFRNNGLFTDYDAKSFFCFPLRNVEGNVVAFLNIIDRNLRNEEDVVNNMLRIFGAFLTGQIHRFFGEKQIKENEFFFAELQKAAFIGVYKADFVNDVWESSEVLDRIFGINSNYDKSISGWLQLVYPADEQMMRNHLFEDVFINHKHFDKEYRIVRVSDGEVRWVHGQGLVMFENDKAVRMAGTIRDITDRKIYEEALKENEKLLRYALSASGAGLWNWDIKTNEIKWTPEFFKLFGLDPEKDVAAPETWTRCVHPDDRELEREKLFVSLNEYGRLESEYRIVQPDGRITWILAKGEAIYNDAGEPLRMAGICIDITSKKVMEEELIRTLNEQKTLNSFFVDRELRMVELKKEINQLLTELGREKKYEC